MLSCLGLLVATSRFWVESGAREVSDAATLNKRTQSTELSYPEADS